MNVPKVRLELKSWTKCSTNLVISGRQKKCHFGQHVCWMSVYVYVIELFNVLFVVSRPWSLMHIVLIILFACWSGVLNTWPMKSSAARRNLLQHWQKFTK